MAQGNSQFLLTTNVNFAKAKPRQISSCFCVSRNTADRYLRITLHSYLHHHVRFRYALHLEVVCDHVWVFMLVVGGPSKTYLIPTHSLIILVRHNVALALILMSQSLFSLFISSLNSFGCIAFCSCRRWRSSVLHQNRSTQYPLAQGKMLEVLSLSSAALCRGRFAVENALPQWTPLHPAIASLLLLILDIFVFCQTVKKIEQQIVITERLTRCGTRRGSRWNQRGDPV